MGRKKMGGEQARDKEDGSDKQREEERTGEERIRKGMERPAEQGGVERMRSTRGATPRYLRLCCSVGVSFPFSVNFRFLGYFWCSFRFRLSSSFLQFLLLWWGASYVYFSCFSIMSAPSLLLRPPCPAEVRSVPPRRPAGMGNRRSSCIIQR